MQKVLKSIGLLVMVLAIPVVTFVVSGGFVGKASACRGYCGHRYYYNRGYYGYPYRYYGYYSYPYYNNYWRGGCGSCWR